MRPIEIITALLLSCSAAVGLAFCVSPVRAQALREERVDLYDVRGNRLGHAQVRGDRVDLYDTRGNRLGYGQQTGDRLDLYTKSGERLDPNRLLLRPDKRR